MINLGLALYNSIEFLKETLDSIIAQTYTDFEVIVVDDGSTDGSGEFCESYGDPRIKVYYNKVNIGPLSTHEMTYDLGVGKYYMLAGHDDLLAPNCLELLVNELESNTNIIFAFPDIYQITFNENNYKNKRLLNLSALHPNMTYIERAKTFMLMPESGGKANLFHSLIRKSVVRETNTLFELFSLGGWGDDNLHVFRLLLEGEIKHVDGTGFIKRVVNKNRWANIPRVSDLKKEYLLNYPYIINLSTLSEGDKKYLLDAAKQKYKLGVQ